MIDDDLSFLTRAVTWKSHVMFAVSHVTAIIDHRTNTITAEKRKIVFYWFWYWHFINNFDYLRKRLGLFQSIQSSIWSIKNYTNVLWQNNISLCFLVNSSYLYNFVFDFCSFSYLNSVLFIFIQIWS